MKKKVIRHVTRYTQEGKRKGDPALPCEGLGYSQCGTYRADSLHRTWGGLTKVRHYCCNHCLQTLLSGAVRAGTLNGTSNQVVACERLRTSPRCPACWPVWSGSWSTLIPVRNGSSKRRRFDIASTQSVWNRCRFGYPFLTRVQSQPSPAPPPPRPLPLQVGPIRDNGQKTNNDRHVN